MIPYFRLDIFSVGPMIIHVWGIMVALGIIAAVIFMNRLAKKYLLSPAVLLDMAMWALVSAFIFARIGYVIFYDPAYYLSYPLDILKIWQGGMSSLGGFGGAALAIWLFAKKRKFSWPELLPYFDVAALGLWLGWGIGRLGCFFIHDHLGRLSNFILAVNFPPASLGEALRAGPTGARLDLGLLESLLAFLLFCFFAFLFTSLIKIRWGLVAGWSIAAYAVARFFLDFLRATDLPQSDARYGGLTPAQWGMVAVLLILIFLYVYGRVRRKNGGVA